jgi:hypothetical protein
MFYRSGLVIVLITLMQQVMLINAVKDVASALGDLIQATKAASGKSINDPSMEHLKDSAKVRLIKTLSAWQQQSYDNRKLIDGFKWVFGSPGLCRPYTSKCLANSY